MAVGLAGALIAVVLIASSASAVGPYPDLSPCLVFPDPPASLSPRAPSLPTEAAWNQDISEAPRDPRSNAYIAYINAHGGDSLHPDFGSPRAYGFPYSVVGAGHRMLPVHYTAYGDESDPGPFPIPAGAPVEGGSNSDGDRHVLVVDRAGCRLYELYRAFYVAKPRPHWNADSGTAWDLRSAARRPEGWTSADAAGLPIFPGLVRYDEVASGQLDHAIRVTVESTRNAWVHPASHCAGDSSEAERTADGPAAAPEGRLRPRRFQRRGEDDRDGDEALRPDRRRQRLQLVLLRDQRPSLGRREPGPAEADPRQRLRGGEKSRPHPSMLISLQWIGYPIH